MTDTPFRTPDEWRRAREAFIEVVIHGWDERLSVADMWAAKFPPINEGNSGNNEEKGGNNFHVSCPPEPDASKCYCDMDADAPGRDCPVHGKVEPDKSVEGT